MSRSRFTMRGYYPGPALAINQVLVNNATLKQMIVSVNDGPIGLAGDMVLTKVSGADARLTIDLRTKPALNMDDWECLDNWEFLKGDTCQFAYANPDGKIIGIELIFEEAE